MSFRLLHNKILASMTLIIECIGWLINVTDNNDIRWKTEINCYRVVGRLNEPASQPLLLSGFIVTCC